MTIQRAAMVLALVAIAVGAYSRYYRLDRKLLFRDETYSLLRITGHTLADYEPVFDGRVRPARQVAALLEVSPGHGLGATLRSIVDEEPQRGPLFYLAARIWIGLFGSSLVALRAFSATLGVLGVGLAYLVGAKMLRSTLGGTVLAALYALSPFAVHYAQQLREYVLVGDATLLSTWLLLRALDRPRWPAWAAYAASLSLALYTSSELILLIAAQGAFVWLTVGQRKMRSAAEFALAACAAGLSYLPLALIERGSAGAARSGVSWEIGAYPLSSFALKWAFNLGAVFYDYELAGLRWAALLVPVLLIEAYAIFRLLAVSRDATVRALCVTTTAAVLVPIVLLDIVVHGHFEATARYQVTTWIGIELIVAAILVNGLLDANGRTRAWSFAAFAYLVGCGAFAVVADSVYVVWWDNNEHISEKAVAAVLARTRDPLIVADSNDGQESFILVLSRYLAPDSDVLFFSGKAPRLPLRSGPTYVFLPDPQTRRELTTQLDHRGGLRNVSPPIGVVIPDLRDPNGAEQTVAPANALWLVTAR